MIEISTIQPFTVILMHTGASPFFNNLPFLMKNKTENDLRAIFTSFLELQNYVFSSKVSLCKKLWISEKDPNSWDFFELNFSPTIYPPIICLKRLFSATCQKKEIPDNVWLSGICLKFLLFSVIRLGLEYFILCFCNRLIISLSKISGLWSPPISPCITCCILQWYSSFYHVTKLRNFYLIC